MIHVQQCSCPIPYQMKEEDREGWILYLMGLAERVKAGQVAHISISVHPTTNQGTLQ